MIVSANADTVARIKNVYLLFHVLPGVMMMEDFKHYIKQTGIQIDDTPYEDRVQERMEMLKLKGAHLRNNDKSIFINKLSPACSICDKGEGAITVDISHNCNRRCYHCFGDVSRIPKGQIYDYLGRVDYFGQMHEIKSMGLSGGEPLLFKSHAVNCLGYVYEKFPDAYKRLYTNGDFVDAEILKELQEVHLDEIRFSIKHEDFDDWKGLRDKMALAGDYIPNVMVEMPVMPGTLDQMKQILVQLDELGIFGINLCEFCYCMHHASEYNERSFKAKFPPFKMFYLGRNQYPGIPIVGSDLESYDLLEFAIDRGMKMGVHYCSLENRLTSPIYDMNHGHAGDPIGYFSTRDFFIKSAIACGNEDVSNALRRFKENGMRDFRVYEGPARYIEFPVDKVSLLKDMEMEIGIVSSVMEESTPGGPGRVQAPGQGRSGEGGVRREKRLAKIDFTHTHLFDFENDV